MKTLGGMVALLLVLTACTGGGNSEPTTQDATPKASETPESLKRDTSPAEPAWTVDLDVIGQPAVVGTVAVVISRESGKRLAINGIDTATGTKTWSHPFSPNDVVPGISLIPRTTRTAAGEERVVFFLAPDKPGTDERDLYTPIVSVDPVTGDIDQRSEPIQATEAASACDDGTDVCVNGAEVGADAYSNLRLDLEKGTLREGEDGAPKDARLIGSAGLFSTNDRPGEKLGVRRDGKTLWSTSLDTVFGKGFTSDNGWAFAHETGPDRYTGSVGAPNDTVTVGDDDETPFVYELSKQKLISFSGKDGTVAWSRDGADPCFKPTDFDDEQAVEVIEHPVRCLVSGTLSVVDNVTTTEGVTMTLEGYDPTTGETVWSHRVADAAATAYYDETPRVLIRDGATVVTTLDDGPSLVDTATGRTAPVGDATFLCQTGTVDFDYVTPWTLDGKKVFGRHGTGLLSSCGADGSPVAGGPTVAAVRDGGIAVDDSTYVLSSDDGVVGYRIP